jgi:hypothetical protein
MKLGRIMAEKEGAMKYRKWDAKTKGMIVLEGLRGKPADINQLHESLWCHGN